MLNKKLIYLLLPVLFVTACSKRAKQNMRIVYDKEPEIEALLETPNINIDSLQTIGLNEDVKQFYFNNEYRLGWSDSENRQQLIDNVANLHLDGISVSNESLAQLQNWNKKYDLLSDEDKIQADFLFSTIYIDGIKRLYNGSINPKRYYGDWEILPKPINTSATMLLSLENHSINIAFDSIRSKQPVYQSLRKKLTSLYNLSSDSLTVLTQAKINDTIHELSKTKKHLTFLNYITDSIAINDIYTNEMAMAIKDFQKNKKLPLTGFVDEPTIKAIYEEENNIKEKLIVNLERWRWFPREFAKDYILVNIPAYSLVSVADNDTIQQHKIVVGTAKRKTPILSSVLSSVVINPTWTVPPTIKKNDLIPKATANRSYFTSQNFTIYDSQGKVVSPENWDPSKGRSYRYVQKGGVGNTLGRIKFLFKNDHAVYLHDTPSQSGFAKNDRNLSSGCVRVEHPFDLLDYVFSILEKDLSKEEIAKIVDSQATKNYAATENPIHVYLLYWTMNVDDKGKITYYKDVYDYDNRLYKQLIK